MRFPVVHSYRFSIFSRSKQKMNDKMCNLYAHLIKINEMPNAEDNLLRTADTSKCKKENECRSVQLSTLNQAENWTISSIASIELWIIHNIMFEVCVFLLKITNLFNILIWIIGFANGAEKNILYDCYATKCRQ